MADDILGLLDRFQPTEQDRRAAMKQALLTAGLGMLGATKGDEFRYIGRGGLLGLGAYQNNLANAQTAAIDRMKAAQMAMALREQQQKFKDADEVRQALGAVQPMQMRSPMQSAMQSAPSLAPTTQNVAAVSQQAANTPAPGVYERLTAMADQLEEQARILKSPAVLAKAQETRLLAEKYAPQYEGTETVMQNGQPVLMQKYKNRAPTAISDFAPKPEYKEVSDNKTKFFYDPLTGKTGGSFAMQIGPEAQLSADMQGRGQDITVRGQNMADARAREQLALAHQQAEQGKWQFDAERGIAVNALSGQARPVMAGDKPLGPKDAESKENQKRGTLAMVDRVTKTVDEAVGGVGPFTTGLPGAVIGKIPGGEAYDLRATVESIKANLGFQQLTEMRQASPTGGALGQVSDQENRLLASTVANLDANQSREKVLANLAKVKQHLANVRRLIEIGQQGQPLQAMPDPLGIRK